MSGRHLSAIGILVLTVCLAVPAASAAMEKWLITPEEATRVRQSTGAVIERLSAVEGPGPLILVKNPKMLERVISPVNIFVSFKPGESGKNPDMKSLTVTLIGFFEIDITDRLREYIADDVLDIEDAELPNGSHNIRLAIKDTAGNPNERDMNINVIAQQ